MNFQKALDIVDTGKKLVEIDGIINSIQYIDTSKNLTTILNEVKSEIIIEMFNLYQKKYNVNSKSKAKVDNNDSVKVAKIVNDT